VIFVTVGSQMPFPRLVRAVDEWAEANPKVEVLAQIGTDTSFRPVAIKAFASVSPSRFVELIQTCELVVAHAGIGTVLTTLDHGKPMLLMPRRAALHETRNDHQVATLHWLQTRPGIYAVDDEAALKARLDTWRDHGLRPPLPMGHASDSTLPLIETMRSFIG